MNLRNAKQTIAVLITSIFLSYVLITTKDLLTRIIVIPFLLFGISFFFKNVCIMLNKNKLAKMFSKINMIAFLIYLFGFITFWCYTSLKIGAYIQIIFSIPFWIVGIFIIRKRFFSQKAKIHNEKKKAKINIDFRILISAFLVLVVFLSGIVMLFLGIKDTYQLKIKTKNYITTSGYYSAYDIFKSDEDGTTYN